MTGKLPDQRDIFWVNLNPTIGHEQRKIRPCLVVSPDWINHGPSELLFVVPMTSKFKNIGSHIRIDPPAADLDKTGYFMPEHLRSISIERLGAYIGTVDEEVLVEVQEGMCMVLGLS